MAKAKAKKTTRRKVPREVTAERERQIWALRQQLKTQVQIAAKLKIAQSTVSETLKRLCERYRAELGDDVVRIKLEHTHQLELIAAEAFEGWLLSRQEAVSTKTVKTDDSIAVKETKGKAKPPAAVPLRTKTKAEIWRKHQSGNAALLAEARQALADIRRIWGIGLELEPEDDAGDLPDPDVAAAAIKAALEAARKGGEK